MSSATLLNDNGSTAQLNPISRAASPAPSRLTGYDRYLANGPQPEIVDDVTDAVVHRVHEVRAVGVRHEPAPGHGQCVRVAVETDDATGLAKRVWAVRLGPHLEETWPREWD